MRIKSVALLMPLLVACTSGRSESGPAAADPPATASASSAAERAAQQACSVYSQGFLWDSREIDTKDDGTDDFTEVFPATGSEVRVSQIADTAAALRQDPRFGTLSEAIEVLVSVYPGGDRIEVLEAEGGMTEACDGLTS